MTATIVLTREEWTTKCAARYVERSGVDADFAKSTAEACAEIEQDEHGEYDPVTNTTAKWTDPAEAADLDMDSWGN